ncbi:MAG: cytochrome c biogenesis protein CcsA [Polyangiaceae bacterium]|nr:cytochrome c biogenesis protein CcsA [Polyangiaceae bacterium]
MAAIATFAFYFGMVCYSVAATLYFVDIARRDTTHLTTRWGAIVLVMGAVLHATHVVTASLLSNVCPVESLHFSLSLCSLGMVAGYVLLRKRLKIDAVGVAVAPAALTFLIGAQFVKADSHSSEVSRRLLALHVTSSLTGVGLFLLAGVAGAFYLVQEWRLRTKRVGFQLPPLHSLDLTSHRLLVAGFPLLTFSVASGASFASKLNAMDPLQWTRAALAYAAWTLVAGVLVLRVIAGWRGRRSAFGTLAGVGCIVLVIGLYVLRASSGAPL